MKTFKSDSGSVFVFATLMIVLLMVLVGMGMDTGWLTYVRSQGQPAVDASALAAASALNTGDIAKVHGRGTAFNASNDYPDGGTSGGSKITSANIQLGSYSHSTGTFSALPDASIGSANAVRVALEQANSTPIPTRVFLTPLVNLFGGSETGNASVNVSAIAALKGVPELPVYLKQCPPPGDCTPNGDGTYKCVLLAEQTPTKTDNSGFTTFFYSSPSASLIKALVKNADCDKVPPVGLGDQICRNEGQVTTVVQEIINVYGKNPDQCFFIPVAEGPSTCTQQVTGFAEMCFKDFNYNDKTSVYKPGKKPGTEYPPGPAVMEVNVTCGANYFQATQCSIPVLVREPSKGM